MLRLRNGLITQYPIDGSNVVVSSGGSILPIKNHHRLCDCGGFFYALEVSLGIQWYNLGKWIVGEHSKKCKERRVTFPCIFTNA